jgi:uncharacterized damage-inducible protein DinB
MTPEILVEQLRGSKEYLDRATRELSEEDSNYKPTEESLTTAQQMQHIAHTVDWFIDGAFGDGFDMDFEGHITQLADMTSLTEARMNCAASYKRAMDVIGSKKAEDMLAPMPAGPIMGGAPKLAIVSGIVDHTAHHRGSLSVYTRNCGKIPPMPYADAPVPA